MRIRPLLRSEFEAIRQVERDAGLAFAAIGMPDVADDEPKSFNELEQHRLGGRARVAVDGGCVCAHVGRRRVCPHRSGDTITGTAGDGGWRFADGPRRSDRPNRTTTGRDTDHLSRCSVERAVLPATRFRRGRNGETSVQSCPQSSRVSASRLRALRRGLPCAAPSTMSIRCRTAALDDRREHVCPSSGLP